MFLMLSQMYSKKFITLTWNRCQLTLYTRKAELSQTLVNVKLSILIALVVFSLASDLSEKECLVLVSFARASPSDSSASTENLLGLPSASSFSSFVLSSSRAGIELSR